MPERRMEGAVQGAVAKGATSARVIRARTGRTASPTAASRRRS